MKLIKSSLLAAALGFNALNLVAQEAPPADRPLPPGPPPIDRPLPPGSPAGARGSMHVRHIMDILAALDANHDGIIDAKELANAPEVIHKLERNRPAGPHPDDMAPEPQDGRRPGGPGGRGPAEFDGPRAGFHGPDGAPMPPGGPDAPRPRRFGPPQGGPEEGGPGAAGLQPVAARHHAPRNPLMEALDTNHDGVLDADEIANATANLKKLDKNNDGKLTEEELRPARPQHAARMQHGPAGGPRPGPEVPPPAGAERGPDGADEAPLPPPPAE